MSQELTPGAQGLEATLQLLAHFEGAPIKIDRTAMSVVITPQLPDTFPVTLYDKREDTMIHAEPWHTHYEEPQQASFCALWLLTPFYRVVEELKGGVLVATWIERYEESGWEGFEPVYFMNPEHPESWVLTGDETYARRYRQQSVLEIPWDYRQFCPEAKLNEAGLPPDVHLGKRLEYSDVPKGIDLFE